jgi:hypothetical protein
VRFGEGQCSGDDVRAVEELSASSGDSKRDSKLEMGGEFVSRILQNNDISKATHFDVMQPSLKLHKGHHSSRMLGFECQISLVV